MKVFDKELLIKDAVENAGMAKEDFESMEWVQRHNGKEVVDGRIIGTFVIVLDCWCREVNSNNTKEAYFKLGDRVVCTEDCSRGFLTYYKKGAIGTIVKDPDIAQYDDYTVEYLVEFDDDSLIVNMGSEDLTWYVHADDMELYEGEQKSHKELPIIEVGDIVRVRNNRGSGWNEDGLMDKYCNTLQVVRSTNSSWDITLEGCTKPRDLGEDDRYWAFSAQDLTIVGKGI